MNALFFPLICAAGFRLRGSELWDHWTRTGTTGGRLLWSALASFCVVAACNWSPLAIGVAPLLFVGVLLGWGSWMTLGREATETNETLDYWIGDPVAGLMWWLFPSRVHYAYQLAMMTIRGLLITAPAGVYLLFLVGWSALPFTLSGLLFGLCYEIGWRIPSRVPHLEIGPPIGEILFGAVVGLSIACIDGGAL